MFYDALRAKTIKHKHKSTLLTCHTGPGLNTMKCRVSFSAETQPTAHVWTTMIPLWASSDNGGRFMKHWTLFSLCTLILYFFSVRFTCLSASSQIRSTLLTTYCKLLQGAWRRCMLDLIMRIISCPKLLYEATCSAPLVSKFHSQKSHTRVRPHILHSRASNPWRNFKFRSVSSIRTDYTKYIKG